MFSMECKGIHHVIGTESISKFVRVPFNKYRCNKNVHPPKAVLSMVSRWKHRSSYKIFVPVDFFGKVSNSFKELKVKCK